MKRGVYLPLTLLAFLFTLGGCIKEDLSKCNGEFNLKFRYVKNSEGVDKFPSEVNKLDVFVYDENDVLVGKFSDAGGHLDASYQMNLPLEPGKYKVITWGNLENELCEMKGMTEGTKKEQHEVTLKGTSSGRVDVIDREIPPVFYGQEMEIEVKANKKREATVDLIKNTKRVRVLIKGLPMENMRAMDDMLDWHCFISSEHGTLSNDNTSTGDNLLQYMPKDQVVDGVMQCDYTLFRLCETVPSSLIVEEIGGKNLFNRNIVEIILAERPNTDFEIEDEFQITLIFSANMEVTVKVEEWGHVELD